jgi:hypothetical protein
MIGDMIPVKVSTMIPREVVDPDDETGQHVIPCRWFLNGAIWVHPDTFAAYCQDPQLFSLTANGHEPG